MDPEYFEDSPAPRTWDQKKRLKRSLTRRAWEFIYILKQNRDSCGLVGTAVIRVPKDSALVRSADVVRVDYSLIAEAKAKEDVAETEQRKRLRDEEKRLR